MQVTLLNYTGCGHPDPLFAAKLLAYTKSTRLEMNPDGFKKFLAMSEEDLNEQLAYIAGTIRSSWEFVDFHFQINDVTRAFTHQLVRTRTASFAQQTQRMLDVSGAGVDTPDTVLRNPVALEAWREGVNAVMAAYDKLQAAGIPNQDCRGIVPTNILTNISVKLNLRTLADIVGKRQNLRAQGEYAHAAQQMAYQAMNKMPWVKPFLYPDRIATPGLDAILRDQLGDRSPTDVPEIAAALKELDKLKGTWG